MFQTNLIRFYDKIMDFLDKGNTMELIYLGLNKAFNTIPQGKLSVRLDRMRITAEITRSWYKGSLQRVMLKGEVSDWKEVTC